MRYLIIREKDALPVPYVWDGEKTHLAMIKEKHIRHESVSSVGYVAFDRSKNDFLITWHTPYADEVNEANDSQNRRIVLAYMRLTYGNSPSVKNKMADEFEAQQKKNAEIMARYFQKNQE